ncbi:MAG: PAS domain S-box protein [Deltaproteobacteria bacterium]|nr:PAS domain S-box protein [Deltaproteobacteria bacterium]
MASSGDGPEREPSSEETLETLCTDRVATIAHVAMVTSRELELARMIEVTLDQAIENLGAAVAYVCTAAEDGSTLLLAGQRHLPSHVADRLAHCGFEKSTLAGRAAITREVQVVNEEDEVDPALEHVRDSLEESGCASMVAVPLLSGSELVGVLTYGLRDPAALCAEDHAVIRIVADILATGIAKAQAYEAERDLRTQLEGLRDAALAIAQEFELRSVLQQIVDQARSVAGARYAALGICQEDPEAPFDPWVFSGLSEERARAIGRTPRPVGLLGAVAREQQTIRTPDLQSDARFCGWPANHPPMRSFLGVGIHGGHHLLGNLYVAEKIDGTDFTAHEERVLELFAQHAAIAIAHAHEHDLARKELAERTRAEAALRESEWSLAFAQRVAGIGSWEWNPATGEVRWSDETYRICGRARDEGPLSFDEFMAMVHPDDREGLRESAQRGLAGHQPRDAAYPRIIRPDGAERVVRQVAEVVFDEEKKPVRVVGIIQDVTEQRRAELAASRLAAIISSSADGIVGKTMDGVVTDWNRAAERQFGWTAAEMIGRPSAVLLPGGESTMRALLERVRRGETIESFETRMLRKDGSPVEVSLTISPIRDAAGVIEGVSTISRDVGAQKHAREALRRSEEQFRLTFEEAPIGVALVDLDGRWLRVNHALCEMTGYDDVELVRMREQDLTDPEDLARGARLSRTAGPEQVLAKRYLCKDGSALPVEVHATVVRDARGEPAHFVCHIVDVSAQRVLERLREEWISIIAHDLRQPVTSISVYAGMHARRTQDAHVKTAFEHILANAHRLDRMIADLLDVSRVESQRLDLELAAVDLAVLAHESLERMTGQTRGDVIRLVIHGEVPRVRVDPQRFEQVLGNLVSNAVKYGEAGAPIVVEIERSGEEVRVSVINRGAGIPQHELGNLFERFGRTRTARRRGIAGLGLGLYITRGIVEAHGGRIWAESEPGATTAFRFTLPLASAAEAARVTRDEARDSLH